MNNVVRQAKAAPKREPLLADRFAYRRFDVHDGIYHPKALAQLQHTVRAAHKFVFDEDAARRVAKVVSEVPDLLVREHRFARAPYDITWIEWPSWAYWQTLRDENPALYDTQGEWGKIDTADHTVGYLIDHGRVNTFAGGTVAHPKGPASMTPLQYRLHTEWPIEDQLEFSRLVGCSRIGLDAAMWGSSYDKLSQDERRILRNYNVIELAPFNRAHRAYPSLMKDGAMADSLRGAVGDLRTVIAILLMLNRPSISRYVQTLPNSRGWLKGKIVPYMAHTVVSVSLDAAQSLRLVGTPQDDANPRRRHEVRGHFCHDRVAREYMRIAGCLHNWQDCDEQWMPWIEAPMAEVHHWRCASCGGKRWWRADHERGTAVKGFIAHDGYDVSI
jgi:hypothetical protein